MLVAGALADRLDRRRTMAGIALLRMVVALGLAVGVALDIVGLPLLYVVAFVLGLVSAMITGVDIFKVSREKD